MFKSINIICPQEAAFWGWGSGLVVGCLPSKHTALCSIPNTMGGGEKKLHSGQTLLT